LELLSLKPLLCDELSLRREKREIGEPAVCFLEEILVGIDCGFWMGGKDDLITLGMRAKEE